MAKKANFELSSGGVVFRKRGETSEILLIKDSYGKWSLPKGHVAIKEQEPVVQAALREITEETGLKKIKAVSKIDEIKYLFKLKGKLIYKKVVFYLVQSLDLNEKVVFQKKELKGAKWYRLEEALKKIGYKNTAKTIQKAISILNNQETRNKDTKKS